MCTKFGVDISSRFLFRSRRNRQTNRQTRLNVLPTPAAIQPAWVKIKSVNTTKGNGVRQRFKEYSQKYYSSRSKSIENISAARMSLMKRFNVSSIDRGCYGVLFGSHWLTKMIDNIFAY